MLSEVIFIALTVIVLMVAISLIKRYANSFFEKISKFVPILVFVIGFVASIVFNKITSGHFEFLYAALFGYFIASAEVYTYEGIVKLFSKFVAFVKKTKEDVKELKKD